MLRATDFFGKSVRAAAEREKEQAILQLLLQTCYQ